jgi:hypothetical protein
MVYALDYSPTSVICPNSGAALGGRPGFEAAAVGDVDADGVNSLFCRTGVINTTTNSLVVASQVYIENEYE